MADSYLEIRDVGDSVSGKTRVWFVYSRAHRDKLAEIKWMARWRQYAFYPNSGTTWNPACLDEISAFCAKKTAAHRSPG